MKNYLNFIGKSKVNRCILAFIIPFILSVIVFSVLNIYPFGNEIYVRSDAYEQYIRFLEFYRKIIYRGDFTQFLYSFSNGFGHGGMLFFAYYLSSPFNLLVLVLPFLDIEMIFMLIVVIKTSMLGMSLYYFFESFYEDYKKEMYIFSTAYAFISFVVLYNINIMWLDALMMLPFILVQLKKMFETKKILKFTLCMFVLYLSNFYMAFMVCLFIVLMLVLSFIFDENTRTDIFEKIKCFFISVLISIFLFGFMMMPVIFELLEFSDMSNQYIRIEKMSLSKVISKLFLFRYDVFFTLRDEGDMLPYIYFGLFLLILSIVFMLFVKNAKKKILLTAALIIILSFIIPQLNLMWHGFDAPTGFDYRYSFLLSFIGIVTAYEGFLYISNNSLNKKESITLFVTVLCLFLISIKHFSLVIFIINLFLIVIYLVFIIYSKYIVSWKEKIFSIILLEMVLNAVMLNLMLTAQFGIFDKEVYLSYKNDEVIESIVSKYYDENYRMIIENELLPSSNTPIETLYKGTSVFNSSINIDTKEKLYNFGLERYGKLSYFLNSNYVIDSIMSVKYIITEKELDLYNKIDTIEIYEKKAYVYENPYVLPIGFVTKKDMKKIDFTTKMLSAEEILKNTINLFSDITGENYNSKDFYEKCYPTKVVCGEKEIKPNKKGDYILKREDVSELAEIKIQYLEKGHITFSVGKECDIADELLIWNDKKDTRNCVYHFKTISGEELVAVLKTYGSAWDKFNLKEINLGDLEAIKLNIDKFGDTLKDVENINVPKNVVIKNNNVKISINIENNNSTFVTSIPYSKSWSAKINGEKADVLKSELSTICFNLEDGLNEIELKYIPKGLQIGCLMTICGAIFLIFYIKKFE